VLSRLKFHFGNARSHRGFRRYFANTSWLLGEKVLRMAVGLFVGVWVARYLGPESFGTLNYAQSFVGLFAAISTLGIDSILIRELVADKSRRDVLLGTAFYLKFIGAVTVLLILLLSTNVIDNNTQTTIMIFVIASATIFQSFNVIDFYFQSRVLSRYIVFSNTIGLFLSSLIKVALIVNEAPLVAFAWVILFDSAILAFGFIYFYFKVGKNIKKWQFRKEIALSLLKDCWPLILSGIVVSVYMKIDQVMIKEMLNAEAVGQYAAAVRLSEAWYFIPVAIAGSLFPAILNAKKQSEELYYVRLQRLFNLMTWLAIAIAIPMTFLSDWVTNFLYGDEYSQAGSVLIIHIWTGVFVFLGVASGKWFAAENLQMLSFWRTFAGMLVNVVLNIFIIPIYGIEGAAMTTLSANFVAAFLFDLFNIKTRGIFLMKLRTFMPHRLQGSVS